MTYTLSYELARREDDGEIRRLLREVEMEGRYSFTLEREPSYFQGASIEGDHQTLIGRADEGNHLVAMVSRSTRDAWIDGEVKRLGYIGQGRIEAAYRGGFIFFDAFEKLRELHEQRRDAQLYTAAIFEDNHAARQAVERNLPGMPTYRRWGTISTLALPLLLRSRLHAGRVEIQRGKVEYRDQIAACLQRNYAPYQFAPYWRAEELADGDRTRGLAIDDFVVALSGGRVVGCLATWDQSSFKQTVVHTYPESGFWRLRPLANLAARLGGPALLPEPGNRLSQVFISHFAVDDANAEIALALLAQARNQLIDQGHAFVIVGLAEGHPLLSAIRARFWGFEQRTVLYLMHWEDGAEAAAKLQRRMPHPEVALL